MKINLKHGNLIMKKNITGSKILNILDKIENDNKIIKHKDCLKSPKCKYYFTGECLLSESQNTDDEIVYCKY